MPTIPPLVRALGKAIRLERERRGLSQEELSARSELDRTYLSGVERGERCPNLRTVLRVSGALGLPLSKLVLEAESIRDGSR